MLLLYPQDLVKEVKELHPNRPQNFPSRFTKSCSSGTDGQTDRDGSHKGRSGHEERQRSPNTSCATADVRKVKESLENEQKRCLPVKGTAGLKPPPRSLERQSQKAKGECNFQGETCGWRHAALRRERAHHRGDPELRTRGSTSVCFPSAPLTVHPASPWRQPHQHPGAEAGSPSPHGVQQALSMARGEVLHPRDRLKHLPTTDRESGEQGAAGCCPSAPALLSCLILGSSAPLRSAHRERGFHLCCLDRIIPTVV